MGIVECAGDMTYDRAQIFAGPDMPRSKARPKSHAKRSRPKRIIRLNAKDSRAFADALLNPREPNARLRAAARRYLSRTGD